MIWPLCLLGLSVLADIVLSYGWFWRWRNMWAVLVMAATAVSAGWLYMVLPSVLSVPVAILAAYRLFHVRRAVHDHTSPQYLRHSMRQSAGWLGGAQLLAAGAALGLSHIAANWHVRALALSLAVLQAAVATIAYASLRRQLQKTKVLHVAKDSRLATTELPSLTVAIPARNEDSQLEACLAAVLASDYPKLEVLVLDDDSRDKTSEIIKAYAHDGVRFIRGTAPQAGWLAKNQAYARLASEASGELVLFCGVDIRLGPSSLRRLVQALDAKHKDMLCVLPLSPGPRTVSLLQSLRYYWEMVPPRRLFKRPPVLSSCWLIRRASLEKAGGFAAVSRSVTPEAHFAREVAAHDGYTFMRSDEHLAVTSEKQAAGQRSTAILTRYPQLHRRVELVALLALGEILLLLGAPLLACAALVWHLGWLCGTLALAATLLHAMVYARLQRTIFPRTALPALMLDFPLAIATDLAYLHYSMYKYEFSTVIWKDRNVSPPVMRHLLR